MYTDHVFNISISIFLGLLPVWRQSYGHCSVRQTTTILRLPGKIEYYVISQTGTVLFGAFNIVAVLVALNTLIAIINESYTRIMVSFTYIQSYSVEVPSFCLTTSLVRYELIHCATQFCI